MPLFEAVTNILMGYGLAVLTQLIVFSLLGLHASFGENLPLCGAFIVMSLICSYA
jgi:hypothetical protein